MRPPRPATLLIAALAAILVLSGCSLAGDVTPPPGSGSVLPPPAAAPAQEVVVSGQGFPAEPPSVANGAAVFADHCSQCHGPGGQGDGEMAGQLQFPPANFTDPALARSATPGQWFALVTQGNLERFMPPFGNSLSEAERWDVVLYLFTLGAGPDMAQTGQAVYEANCAACHGEAGAGDGPEAPAGSPLPDLGDQERLAGLSQADLFQAISEGVGEGMPAFAGTLTDEERWAAAAYVRAFSFDTTAPEVEAAAEPATAQGAIAGQVTNGTLGAPVTASLDVVLYGFDDFQLTTTLTETLQPDGTFLFEGVPFQPGRAFIVTTEYSGVPYGSDVVSFEGDAARLNVPLNVYETTTEPTGLRVDRMHVFFDFTTGSTTVGELFILSNTGNETVLGGKALQFELPAGASNLRVEGLTAGEEYVETPQGFTLTQPIPPGANAAQLLISFSLPFERNLDFAQTLPFPVGTANVLVPDLGVRLSGEGLQTDGPRDVQGTRFLSYSASDLPAGGVLSFRLSGQVSSGAPGLTADWTGVVVGAVTLALVTGGVGWWYYSRTRGEAPAGPAQAAEAEELLQMIADLDDDFETGRLKQGEYQRRRSALKARLIHEGTRKDFSRS